MNQSGGNGINEVTVTDNNFNGNFGHFAIGVSITGSNDWFTISTNNFGTLKSLGGTPVNWPSQTSQSRANITNNGRYV